MSRQIKNLAASVLERLRNASSVRNQIFQETLTYYGLERFLYRRSQSEYHDRFVLKGALVMLTWPSRIIRTTRDMDFRAFIDSDLEEVSRTLKEICETAVEADAIRFDAESIRVEVINERATYPGIRARFVG
jgi:predicted nucleotidyltransferase component of viral defense system